MTPRTAWLRKVGTLVGWVCFTIALIALLLGGAIIVAQLRRAGTVLPYAVVYVDLLAAVAVIMGIAGYRLAFTRPPGPGS